MEGINEKTMLDEIAAAGYKRPTIYRLHYSKKPLSKSIVTIILKWLPKIYEDAIGAGEFLVWSLTNTEDPYKPDILLDLFDNSNLNDTLKQTLAHILSVSKIETDISRYIKKQLLSKPASFSRVGFVSALEGNANFATREELIVFLKEIFCKYDYYECVFKLFKKYGTKTDIDFLKGIQSVASDKKKIKQIEQVITHINNRKRIPLFHGKKR